MTRLTALRGLLGLWVLWHIAFGLLSTFAPELGAQSVGWEAEGGWDAPLITMSTQYGMVMLLLAVMYGLMALDPLRYLDMIAVAIVEQILGVLYAIYIYIQFGQLTMGQFLVQAAINAVIVIVFALLWSGLRDQVPRTS